MIRRRCVLPFLTIALAIFLCAAPFASAAPPTTAPAGIDPKADEVLRRMGATLANAKRFTFRIHDMADEVMDNGQKVQISKTIDATVRRPDGIAADVRGDNEDLRFVFDGKHVLLFNRRNKTFAIQDVPDNIDAMFDLLAARFGLTAPLSDLMFADPYATLIERARQGFYLGEHQAGDANCHHLAFRQEGLDWQIWIEDTPAGSVPRKVVITYKEQPGHPQFIAQLDDWNLSPKSDDSAFNTAAPAGATRRDLVRVDQPAAESTTAPTTVPSNP